MVTPIIQNITDSQSQFMHSSEFHKTTSRAHYDYNSTQNKS